MDYSFNVQLAEQYGVEEAVLLNHLYFWIQHNAANKKHFHDGRYWTYNSAQAFTEIFPFWSRKKIDRLVQSLKEKNAVIIGNFNESGQDRTRWFSIEECVLSVIENRPSIGQKQDAHWTESSNSLDESVQPLPDSKPDINTDTKITLAHFEEFWASYPKKKSKEAARRAFEKLSRSKSAPSIDRLLESVKEHMRTPEWQKQDGQFIPYPATYLNAGSYDDEITPAQNIKPNVPPKLAPLLDEKGNLIE